MAFIELMKCCCATIKVFDNYIDKENEKKLQEDAPFFKEALLKRIENSKEKDKI